MLPHLVKAFLFLFSSPSVYASLCVRVCVYKIYSRKRIFVPVEVVCEIK